MADKEQEPSPLKRALVALKDMRARLDAAEQAKTEPIAIIGMACRFPGNANDPDAFWRLLQNGPYPSRRARRSRSAFPTTETEEKLIAAAANIGDSSQPKTG